eukprot:1843080-Pleurochrysis_carterae.AAC.1
MSWPPNCQYADSEQRRTKAVALEAIKLMAERNYPLSSSLLALAGITWLGGGGGAQEGGRGAAAQLV